MTFRAPSFSPSKRGVKTLESQILGDGRLVALSLTAKPFFQSQWPSPPPRFQVGASSVVLNVTLALVTASGIAATLITGFGGYAWGTAPWAGEPPAIGVAAQAPFTQTRWDGLSKLQSVKLGGTERNLLLTQLAPPVGQAAQTSLPRSIKRVQVPTLSTALTFEAATHPFVQTAWLRAAKRPVNTAFGLSANTLVSQLAPPVGAAAQASPLLRKAPVLILEPLRALSLYAATLPIGRVTWAVQPTRLKFESASAQNNLLALTASADTLPFGQNIWPRLARYDAKALATLVTDSQNLILTPGLTPSGGSIVVVFSGVSRADGLSYHQGISTPTIILTDAGGGTYNVAITHQLHGEKTDTVSDISYLIDGELP